MFYTFPKQAAVNFRQVTLTAPLIRNLPSFVVQMVVIPVDQLRERNKGIPLILQVFDECIECLSGKLCPIMAKYDASAP